ncbi:hypothetical protein GCM10009665_14710 [Kitasatospora nipponensis]|uniref:F5/8 type C domain-containing protein n=1 Tax=Kitasatospora nipponensis TaxID=258049 RepID=A0ABN1VW43_9ACTN
MSRDTRLHRSGAAPTTTKHRPAIGAAMAAAIALVAGTVGAASAGTTTGIPGDLACGAVTTTSSNSGSAAAVTDCTAGTTWQSSTSSSAHVNINLGSTQALDHLTIVWGSGYATKFAVRTSPDGSSWHTQTTVTGGTGGTQTVALPAGVSARHVQLLLDDYAGSNGYVIDEVEVFGPGPTGTPSQSAGPTTSPTSTASPTPTTTPSAGVPQTVVLDGATLAATRARLQAGDPALTADLKTLRANADSALTAGPWSVTDKTQTPPSGDKHDYLSQAPYWWPTKPATASNPYGCPYVQKDGQRNPAVDDISDHKERAQMFNAVYSLTLAWYYTGDPTYAQRAELDLRTWFTNPATAMNPNLDYAQFIPCSTAVRGEGGIDFSQQFTDVIDATALLDNGAPGWTGADHTAMTNWYSAFLHWNRTSANGQAEFNATNNHGSFAAMEEAALAVATGQTDLARSLTTGVETRLLPGQLNPDGSQPQELARTRSFHYSAFNLLALTRLSMIGRHLGVDLWHYSTPAGGSIVKSVDYLIPAATGAASWNHPELDFQPYAATDVIHAAAAAGDPKAVAAQPKLPAPPGGDLWALRPAPEQLDPIS